MNDFQLGPGRRGLRYGNRRFPAGNPQEFLDLQTHFARLAVLFLLAGWPFSGQRERGRFARRVYGCGGDGGRWPFPVAATVIRLFLFDLFAVFGQQLAIGDGNVVWPELVVGKRTVGAVVHGTGALGRRQRRRRRRRFRSLAFDAPGTFGRTVAGDRSLYKI